VYMDMLGKSLNVSVVYNSFRIVFNLSPKYPLIFEHWTFLF